MSDQTFDVIKTNHSCDWIQIPLPAPVEMVQSLTRDQIRDYLDQGQDRAVIVIDQFSGNREALFWGGYDKETLHTLNIGGADLNFVFDPTDMDAVTLDDFLKAFCWHQGG